MQLDGTSIVLEQQPGADTEGYAGLADKGGADDKACVPLVVRSNRIAPI